METKPGKRKAGHKARLNPPVFWVDLMFVDMATCRLWFWRVRVINGKGGASSRHYRNKAQCRNAGRRFAEYAGIEFRENVNRKEVVT
jgi:hypothetical protein